MTRIMEIWLNLIFALVCLRKVSGFPQTVTDAYSYVTSSDKEGYRQGNVGPEQQTPNIYEMRIDSHVYNRFATTLVMSKVKNSAQSAQEAIFSVILPKKAFISKFTMLIDGKNYEAYIKEKQEAQQLYDQAIASGLGAAHVATSARDSNRFTVSVNVLPKSQTVFLLTYEELLQREDDQYELIINIFPKQPVEYLRVNVWINESLPIRFVRAPAIRSGNDINDPQGDLDPRAIIRVYNFTSATVAFSPTTQRQKELAKSLGTNYEEGLSGQFVVQYDVDRNLDGGEILLEDGYFVHFFAPIDIPALPKHVLFVLDTSGSMSFDTKLEQLKTAMTSIIAELKDEDVFHILEFNTFVKVFNIINTDQSVQYESSILTDILEKDFPSAFSVDEDNKMRAIEIISGLVNDGWTNIYDALRVALHLVDRDKQKHREDVLQPLIIFLTDGDATQGIIDPDEILSKVTELNIHSVPIFCLSFGGDANRKLLQKLSLRNRGFSRHIYEAADAFLQLEDFYQQISSPLLSNVKFKYTEGASQLTKTEFPMHFAGSELVVSGAIGKEFSSVPKILGQGAKGPINLVPVVRKPVAPLERFWAYLTIQQLLEDKEIVDDKQEYDEKILNLAKKYSFVTPVSSLVVVKPNGTDTVIELEAADKGSDAGSTYAVVPSLSSEPSPSPPEETTTDLTMFNPVPIIPTNMEELKKNLPWLEDHLVGNNFIRTSKGDLEVDLNKTSTDRIVCPSTLAGGQGVCIYLHECAEIHFLLTNIYIYQQYYCPLDRYAAICCASQSHFEVPAE